MTQQKNTVSLELRDLSYGAINGAIFGFMSSFVLKNLGINVSPLLPLVAFSFLAVFGVYVGAVLARWKPFFFQLAKFAAVGSANFSIDFGIYNAFMLVTQVHAGSGIDIFKGIAFMGAVVNSYFWNKHWSFAKKDSASSEKEFSLFLGVSVIGAILSVGIVHLFVNIIGSPVGFDPKKWANIANVGATVVVLIWNFLGYKFFVFKK